jgi:hypothetical protein
VSRPALRPVATGLAVLAGVVGLLLVPVGGASADPAAISPGNVPTALPGATNGELSASDLIAVAPNCLAARAAASSLGLLLRTAREQNVVLGTEECYRSLAGQIAEAQIWTGLGNSACAASVPVGPTGPVGTSMHGWGKAADLFDSGGSVAFGSSGYRFLKANAGRLGWNHPGWAEPGGSACPEAWHWEWVGDGGTLHAPPIRADVVGLLPSADGGGYSTITGLGALNNRGDAAALGDVSSVPLSWLVVGGARSLGGYWLVASDGGVFSFGSAGFYGSTGAVKLNQPIVGMASTPDGKGYWLVAADGGVFTFGDARFYGSTGALRLNRPIVGMASTPDGRGYWLVASDGGIFTFGDAAFYGSTGAVGLSAPVVGMASTPDGKGYWLVASDGGIFTFGAAPFLGSEGGASLATPVVGMAPVPGAAGYWLTAADGSVYPFGAAHSYGAG